MTAREARIYFSEFDDLLLTNAAFSDAALSVLKQERPFETFSPATAGTRLIDHWIEHGYLKSYKAGSEFNPFTEDIRVLPDDNGDYSLAMRLVEHDLYIDKAEFLALLAEWNMPQPEGLYAIPNATLLKHRIDAIISAAEALRYDPMSIPYGGKREIKERCLLMLGEPCRFTESTFVQAWKKASQAGLLSVQDKDIYQGK